MSQQRYSFEDLVAIMAKLRSPEGCPWDKEQTLKSLRSYLLEETHEVLEAIDGGDPLEHCEELGDLQLQIVFQSQLASEEEQFDAYDVVDSIARKLVRRHPHIFADASAQTPEDVLRHWERIKKQEKKGKGEDTKSLLDGVPQSLPALLGAHLLSERAARVGFDWPNPRGVLAKVREEVEELEEALAQSPKGDSTEIHWEAGDLLFALSNLCRHLGFDAEDALREANTRFRQRFALVEEQARLDAIDMEQASIDTLEELWQRAKLELKGK